jgi:hypothetical protein
MLLTLTMLAACVVDGRARRTDALVSVLAPKVHLGQPLDAAQEAIPSLLVRHRGDPPTVLRPLDDDAPRIVQAIVLPEPLAGQRASAQSPVSGLVFVMTPATAAQLRVQIRSMLGHSSGRTCAGRSVAERDSVVVWSIDGRGGAILTYPERRPAEAEPVARLFIYTGAWHPELSISGYGRTDCTALADDASLASNVF